MSLSLDEKVQAYLDRATKEGINPGKYTSGLYQVHSGTHNEWGNRDDGPIIKGRFIDAVAYLVNMPSYGGWYLSNTTVEEFKMSSNGYLRKIDPIPVPKYTVKR